MLLNRLKLIFFVAIISNFQLASAGTMGDVAEVQEPPLYTLFLGATAGMGMYDGTYHAANLFDDSHSSRNAGNSFLGGGIAGIESKLDEFYLAIVGNAIFNTLSQDGRVSTNFSGTRNHIFSYKNNFQYGGNFRLGANLWGASPYLMGGLEAGTWEMQLGNNGSTFNRGITPFSNYGYKQTLVGPQAGMGFILAVENFNVGMEFAHTWFGTIRQSLLDPTTGISWNHKNKIEQNQFMISAAYKFYC